MRLTHLLVGAVLFLLPGCGGGGGSAPAANNTGGGNNNPSGPPPAVAVSISPTTASLAPAGTQTFTAGVSNATITAVSWSVQEGAAGGSITAAGVYTAPNSAGIYHVIATSQADTTKIATALVTVHVAVGVAPASVTLTLGQTQTFTATVQGSANTAVTWSVQEGAAGGSITTGGVYTPPKAAGTFHVIATSQADNTEQATAAVTVQAGSATGTIQ